HGGGYLDPQTRQYKLFIEVNKYAGSLLSGEFVHVTLLGKKVENSLKIPESAYTREGKIWYVDEENRLGNFQGEVLFFMGKDLIIKNPVFNKTSKKINIAVNPLSSFITGKTVTPQIRKSSL
ncbi:MAG: hypothetical protein OIF32_07530, partial [Campylobacterales bacterium]|nr:hypothetical protein [Campylobacterales bacterium]